MRLTFKRQPPERGLASVGHTNRSVDIKIDKKVVGVISAPNWSTTDQKWRIRLTVDDQTKHCGWKWIVLNIQFDDETQAREWLQNHITTIAIKFTLHPIEDDD